MKVKRSNGPGWRPEFVFHVVVVLFAALCAAIPYVIAGMQEWQASRTNRRASGDGTARTEATPAPEVPVGEDASVVVSGLYHDLLSDELGGDPKSLEWAAAARSAVATKTFQISVEGNDVRLTGARTMTLVTSSYLDLASSRNRKIQAPNDTIPCLLTAAREAATSDAARIVAAARRTVVVEPERTVGTAKPPKSRPPQRRKTKAPAPPKGNSEIPTQKPPSKPEENSPPKPEQNPPPKPPGGH